MLKLTKKADYGLIALKHLAEGGNEPRSAKEIAEAYNLPQEALAKILQRLAKAGLLSSQHGTNGGYSLARSPRAISAFEVIRAIEGPLFITACSTHRGDCQQLSSCNVKEPLRKVNDSIQEVLKRLSLADMQDARTTEPQSGAPALSAELVTLV
jgi:FeS assembly SUF system regulator